MIIPYQDISSDALQGLIEEFITREGTDYGDMEYTLADKVEQVKQQLQQKQIFIIFDSFTECCNIVTKEQLPSSNQG